MRLRAVAVVGAIVIAAGVTSAASSPTGEDVAFRHPSGLSVVAQDREPPIPEKLRDAAGALEALSEANPDDFGYVSADPDGTLRLGVATGTGHTALAAFLQGKAPAPAKAATNEAEQRLDEVARQAREVLGLSVTEVPGRARSQVEADKDFAIGLSLDPRFADAGVWQTHVERESGRVIISVENLTDVLAQHLVDTYGASNVAVDIAPNPESSNSAGRLADNSPHYGGARIAIGTGNCTDAFAWLIDSSTPGMLTAGHCAPSGDSSVSTPTTTNMGFVTSASRENYSSAGTVYFTGQSTYRGDLALIQNYSTPTSHPYIYRGAYNSASNTHVSGKFSRRAQSGDQYCTGGSYSGEICGWIVDLTQTNRTMSTGDIKRNIVISTYKKGWCVRPGDSGGSVFIVSGSNIVAKGVHNGGGGGGSDYYGGATDPCHEIFTDIWDAYYGLPGDLRT